MDPFTETMTATVADRFVRIARKRRFERRGAWRNAINNFRPANPAKAQDILANLTCAHAAPKESQGV